MDMTTVDPPTRHAVLEALEFFSAPVGLGEVRAYCQARGLPVPRGALADLLAGERGAYDAGERPDAWICPALRVPALSADEQMVTRSDWEPGWRLSGDQFERTRQLWLTRQMCDIAATATDARGETTPGVVTKEITPELAAAAEAVRLALRYVLELPRRPRAIYSLVDMGRDHSVIERGYFAQCREIAEAEHGALAEGEERVREAFAARLDGLDERALLFGKS
jgi:hypothetical protein